MAQKTQLILPFPRITLEELLTLDVLLLDMAEAINANHEAWFTIWRSRANQNSSNTCAP